MIDSHSTAHFEPLRPSADPPTPHHIATIAVGNGLALLGGLALGGAFAALLVPCAGVGGLYLTYRVIKEW